MFFRGSSALRNVARRAGEVFEELGHPRLYGEEKSGDLVGSGLVAEFAPNSATFGSLATLSSVAAGVAVSDGSIVRLRNGSVLRVGFMI